MTQENIGGQYVSVKYHAPVDSIEVNRRFYDVRPVGIYRGGYVSYSGSSPAANISPFVAEIKDRGSTSNQVRVNTTATITLNNLVSSSPYIILRWNHEEDKDGDYVSIMTVSSPETTDVIVGKLLFQGTNVSGVSYSERTYANNRGSFLKIVPDYPTPSARVVYNMPGVLRTAQTGQYIKITENRLTLPASPPVGGLYIYCTDSGNITYTSSISAVSGKILLAKIVYDGTNPITEDKIDDLRSFLSVAVIPDNSTVYLDSTGVLRVANSGIKENHIAKGAITTEKIAEGAVEHTRIAAGEVYSANLRDAAVITQKIANQAITTEKVAISAITGEKLNANAADNITIRKNSNNQLEVKDGGITFQKIYDGIVQRSITGGLTPTQDSAFPTSKAVAEYVSRTSPVVLVKRIIVDFEQVAGGGLSIPAGNRWFSSVEHGIGTTPDFFHVYVYNPVDNTRITMESTSCWYSTNAGEIGGSAWADNIKIYWVCCGNRVSHGNDYLLSRKFDRSWKILIFCGLYRFYS